MRIGGMTKVFALFGDPVGHSLSPIMQNTAFQALGMDCCYVTYLVHKEDLSAAVQAVRALHLGGVNLTIPHKESVLQYLDEVQEDAQLIRAVNTIVNRDGCLFGYNTDAPGFLASLKSTGFDPNGKRVLIIGAGGAARAAAFALAKDGAARIDIFNRSSEKAEKLAQDLLQVYRLSAGAREANTSLIKSLKSADLLINATPVGMYPNHRSEPLLTREQLHPGLLVYDLIYNPLKTRLLEEAEAAGCRVLSGLEMLVWQGVKAFQLWTGREAPVDLMQDAVLQAFKET